MCNISIIFALFVVFNIVISENESCKLGERRRIGKRSSYFEECKPKFETAGCYATWVKDDTKFVEPGQLINRLYRNETVGFTYKCEMSNGYISFQPIGCAVKKKDGLKLIKLNESGTLENGQAVNCKADSEGDFSFEFGPTERTPL